MRKLTETAEVVDTYLEKKEKGFLLEGSHQRVLAKFEVISVRKDDNLEHLEVRTSGDVVCSCKAGSDLYEKIFDLVKAQVDECKAK